MTDINLTELVISALIVIGALFALVGSIGLARLPDAFMRLHGPTKATTLGVGSILLASVIFFSTRGAGISLHEVLVLGFLFVTAPVSAHMLAKAALHLRVQSRSRATPYAASARRSTKSRVKKVEYKE